MRDDLHEMTAAELVRLHDRLCPEGDRIGRPWKRAKAELVDRVRPRLEAGEHSAASGPTEAKASATEDAPATVGKLVECLLVADDGTWSYAAVVEEVRRRFPQAKTTRRSVASVAADLRRRGLWVRTRRTRHVTARSGQLCSDVG